MQSQVYRDDKELLEDILRRAYRPTTGTDARFKRLLERISEAARENGRAA